MATAPVGAGLQVDGVEVRFGDTVAVDGVSIDVEPGEVVALVGPSGCGKSTLLRAVAGLEPIDRGAVTWAGTDLASSPPERRGFGLMFQDHALFPHRTVGQNVAFGLRIRGGDRIAVAGRVAEVLELVGLAGFEARTVDTLSGGEAQRVALARSLAPSPRLLMLDEPLGSLDRVLRDRLARDLRHVLTELGLAAVHVTHDQEEAYAVADRLVVMRDGRVVRDGPAADVWRHPRDGWVARFLGHRNVLAAEAARALGVGDGSSAVVVHEAAIRCTAPDDDAAVAVAGRPATVVDVRFRGATSLVTLRVAAERGEVDLAVHLADPPPAGAAVRVAIDPVHVDQVG